MNKRCRSCLTSSKIGYSLQTVFPEFARRSLSVVDLLSVVTSSEINLSEEFPSKICPQCIKSLKSAYSFIESFKKSQKILESYIHNIKLKVYEKNDYEDVDNVKENEEKIIIITEKETMNDASCDINISSSPTQFRGAITECRDEMNNEQDEDSMNDVDSDEDIEELHHNEDNFDEYVEEQICPTSEPDSFTQRELYNCIFCANAYITNNMLLEHIKNKHPSNSKVKTNEAVLKNTEPYMYTCNICDTVFDSKTHFQAHNRNYHDRRKDKYRCNICNVLFKSKSAARYHKLSNHSEKNFVCSLCEKRFMHNSHLKKHIEAVHEKSAPDKFLCSICGRGFKYTTALKYHMGKKHSTKRDYICGYCGDSFILIGQLRCHERKHTNERPFHCQYCEKTFKRSAQKKRHENTHLGIYPHQCEYCEEKVFTSRSNMKVHWLSHQGDNTCEECGKGFAAQEILNFHYQSIHKIKKNTE